MIIFTLLFLTVWTLLTLCLLLDISRWCWKIAVAAMTLPNARNATHLSWFWSQSFIQWYSVIHHDTALTSHYNIIIIHYELWLNIPCFLEIVVPLQLQFFWRILFRPVQKMDQVCCRRFATCWRPGLSWNESMVKACWASGRPLALSQADLSNKTPPGINVLLVVVFWSDFFLKAVQNGFWVKYVELRLLIVEVFFQIYDD